MNARIERWAPVNPDVSYPLILIVLVVLWGFTDSVAYPVEAVM